MSIYEWLPHVAIILLIITTNVQKQWRAEKIPGALRSSYAKVCLSEDVGKEPEAGVEDNNQEHRLTTPDEVRGYISEAFSPLGGEALAWGLRVGLCESSYRQFDSDGDLLDNGVGCFGVFQFKRATFNAYCTGKISNARDQIDCAAGMWQKGLQHHWECK